MRVAYVLQRFPFLTETFVAEEIAAHVREGVDVVIVSLLSPGEGPVQPTTRGLLGRTWTVPGFGRVDLWIAAMREFLRAPTAWTKRASGFLQAARPDGTREARSKRWAMWVKVLATTDRLRGQEVDRVHSHFAWLSGAAGLMIARALGVPFTVTVHAYDLFTRDDLLDWICSEADEVIAISEFNRGFVLDRIPAATISVIRCGLDLDAVPKEQESAAEEGGLRVVAVGSLVPKKGHEDLVEAVALARERGAELRLRIVGGGPGEAALRAKVAELGLSAPTVELLGALTQPEALHEVACCDVFALACRVAPSGDRDGIPVAMMEAAYLGKPLVSTRVSGIPELVVDGENGLLTDSGDVEALSDALVALAASPARRAEMGRLGRDRVIEDYDVEKNARRLRERWEDPS
jgi:glycosyltransferase involved in cell wall biosynthesis